MRPYKLAISNIAWTESEDERIFNIMKKNGFYFLEIAPSRTWNDPYGQTDDAVANFRTTLKNKGLEIIAFQSLLFGHPEMTMFTDKESRRNTLEYLKKNIVLGEKVGARTLVFGSPKNRIVGNLPSNSVRKVSKSFFGELGDFAADKNISVCIEPNPTIYGGDFICTTQEAVDFVLDLGHSNIGLNIDLGTITANKEDAKKTIENALPYAHHFHISEPYLEMIALEGDRHKTIAQILNNFGYDRTVSIEMKAQENEGTRLKNVTSALEFVSAIY